MNRDRFLAAIHAANNTYRSRLKAAEVALDEAYEVKSRTIRAAEADDFRWWEKKRKAEDAYTAAHVVYRMEVDAAKAERDRAYIAAFETEITDREGA